MYGKGHTGISLILYAPINAILIINSLYLEAVIGLAIILFFSSFPDIDIKISFIKHRGITHTIWFAFIIGFLCAFSFYLIPEFYEETFNMSTNSELIMFFVGTISIINHIVGDMITPAGIEPFSLGLLNKVYPFSKLSFTDNKYRFVITKAKNENFNTLFLVLGMIIISFSFIISVLHQVGLLIPTLELFFNALELIYQAFKNFFSNIF